MKHTKVALLTIVAGLALPFVASSAFAQDYFAGQNAYVGISGGANIPTDSWVNYAPPAPGPLVPANTTFDTGYILSGQLGYRFMSGMRTELEFNYRKANLNSIGGSAASGQQDVMGLMANVTFEVADLGGFRPYIGGGAGVGWNKWSNVATAPSLTFPGGTGTYNYRDAAFQWQGIAGITRKLTDNVDGFIEYRFIGLEGNKFAGTGTAMANGHDDRSHNALVGIRYNF